MPAMTWSPDRHPNYIKLDGYVDALVRTKPTPNGRILWSYGKVYDYAATVDEAKEMVEGLAVIEPNQPAAPTARTFADLSIEKETFDFVNPATPGANSFYERLYKIGPRTYRCVSNEAHKIYGKMRVGSIKAPVFNVR